MADVMLCELSVFKETLSQCLSVWLMQREEGSAQITDKFLYTNER